MILNNAKKKHFCHGGDIYSAESPSGSWLDFSANINPLGLAESVKNAIVEGVDGLVHYPDPQGRELKQAISVHYGVSDASIVLGNGAAELFYVYFHTKRPGRVLLPVPSFSEYEKSASCCGAELEYFYLAEEAGFQPDLAALARKLPGFDAVILGNPNNPTGCLLEAAELEELIGRAAETHTDVMVDESFLDFLPDRDKYSVAGLVEKYSNLLVVSSLTKLFAIPGLRLGFGLANRELVQQLELHKDVWNVNLLAQRAGVAALQDFEYIQRTREHTAATVEKMLCELQQVPGVKVYPTAVNFVLLNFAATGMSSGQLVAGMKQKGILIRDCSSYPGLEDSFVRLAIRGSEENAIVIRALKECLEDKR